MSWRREWIGLKITQTYLRPSIPIVGTRKCDGEKGETYTTALQKMRKESKTVAPDSSIQQCPTDSRWKRQNTTAATHHERCKVSHLNERNHTGGVKPGNDKHAILNKESMPPVIVTWHYGGVKRLRLHIGLSNPPKNEKFTVEISLETAEFEVIRGKFFPWKVWNDSISWYRKFGSK